MEQTENTAQMLDLLTSPAFSVENGAVKAVNRAAAQYMIEPGRPVGQLLAAGVEEYAAFEEGCLYVQLTVLTHRAGASVTRMGTQDIFIIDQEPEALQALALAARELRIPLSDALTNIDRLFSAFVQTQSEELQQQMASVNRCLYQILRIVGNMSDTLRYTADTALSKEILDICAWIQEIFDRAAAMAEDAGVTVRLKNLREVVYCPVDREMLERAIYNLLSNAIRFSPKGSVVQATVSRSANRLQLTVQDAGTGIPADILGSIYSRYTRTPGIEDGPHGIGLGMALVRSAAAAHGGTVLIRQLPGQGTSTTVSLSLKVSEGSGLHAPVLKVDYAGERDHALIEFSNVLPAECYRAAEIN